MCMAASSKWVQKISKCPLRRPVEYCCYKSTRTCNLTIALSGHLDL